MRLSKRPLHSKIFSLFRPVDYLNPSQEFMDALLDDLNTPRAIAELHRLYKVARSNIADLADRAQNLMPQFEIRIFLRQSSCWPVSVFSGLI